MCFERQQPVFCVSSVNPSISPFSQTGHSTTILLEEVVTSLWGYVQSQNGCQSNESLVIALSVSKTAQIDHLSLFCQFE